MMTRATWTFAALAALLSVDGVRALLSAQQPPAALQADADALALWPHFVDYASEFGKDYRWAGEDDALVLRRFQAFAVSAQRIQTHNAAFERGEYSFTLGLNRESRLDP